MQRLVGRTLLPCGFLLLLAACSGGGGGGGGGGGDNGGNDDTDPGPQAATADSTLLPFVTGTGDLLALDPASPLATPLTLDTGLTVGSQIQHGRLVEEITDGTFVAASNAIADPHFPYALYIKGGVLFRVNLLAGQNHEPVQVSSLADACRIRADFADYADVLATRLIIDTAGPDTDCAITADNPMTYLRLDTPSTTAPAALTVAVRKDIHGSDGSLTEFLTHVGDELWRYGPDLTPIAKVADLVNGTTVDVTGPAPSNTLHYLVLDNASDAAGACVYRYNASTGALTACLHELTSTAGPFGLRAECDGTHTYIGDGQRVFRVAHTGTSASEVHDAGDGFSIRTVWLSASRVAYDGTDIDGNAQAAAVPRAGGTAAPLYQGTPDDSVGIVGVAGTRVYLEVNGIGGTTAYIAPESGTGIQSFENAGWSSVTPSSASLSLGLRESYTTRLHAVLGEVDPVSGDTTISSYDAAAGTLVGQLGIIYYGSEGLALGSVPYGLGRYRLAQIDILRAGGGMDADVYFADTATAGSLQGIATFPGENERVFN